MFDDLKCLFGYHKWLPHLHPYCLNCFKKKPKEKEKNMLSYPLPDISSRTSQLEVEYNSLRHLYYDLKSKVETLKETARDAKQTALNAIERLDNQNDVNGHLSSRITELELKQKNSQDKLTYPRYEKLCCIQQSEQIPDDGYIYVKTTQKEKETIEQYPGYESFMLLSCYNHDIRQKVYGGIGIIRFCL